MKRTLIIIALALVPFVLTSCATHPSSPEAKTVLTAEVDEAIALFKEKDPSIERFFTKSYGYAVFPKIFKGAFWVGGAGGRGEVFADGKMTGYSTVGQATLGLSFGGGFYREIVFFRDKEDLNKFKTGEYTFAAEVTGVALSEGVAAKADYKSGLAVFVLADKGLMIDVSVGGQKFKDFPDRQMNDRQLIAEI